MVLTGKYIAWGLIILGALIDFISIKKPSFARSLFHLEMLQLTLLKLIPFDEDRSTYPSFYFEIFLDPLFNALCFAVDLKLSIIMLFCSQGFSNVYLNSLWSKFDQFDDL